LGRSKLKTGCSFGPLAVAGSAGIVILMVGAVATGTACLDMVSTTFRRLSTPDLEQRSAMGGVCTRCSISLGTAGGRVKLEMPVALAMVERSSDHSHLQNVIHLGDWVVEVLSLKGVIAPQE